MTVDGHRENHGIRRRTFGLWLRKLWFDEYVADTGRDHAGAGRARR